MGSCACSLAMNTVNANVSECQAQCCCCTGDGGASNLSSAINAVGRWGTVLLATGQGKPVVAGRTAVGAKGSATVPNRSGFSGGMLILVLVIIAAFFFILRR